MTAIDVTNIAKPEPKRDRWGRYLIPTPNGKPVGHTRATTVAKTIDDTTALEKWKLRQVARGIGLRKDLHALAASHDPNNDRRTFDDLCDKALEAAKGTAAASTGTALHRFTEDLDAGRIALNEIPDEWRPHITRYQEKLTEAGVEIHPEWIEQIFVDDSYTIAGTGDRIVTLADGRRLIADLKTGRSLDYAWLSICIQMAMYANHTATYDPATDQRGPRVDVDRTEALIIHLPAEGDTCELHIVDLNAGYEGYIAAIECRAIRKTKNLARPYKPLNGGTGGTSAQRDWIRARIQHLANNRQAVVDLRNRWPAGLPQPFPTEPTTGQVDRLAAALDQVEALHQIAFEPTRPGAEPTTTKTRKQRP